MPNSDSNNEVASEARRRRHEHRNPRPGGILLIAALVVLTVAVSFLVVWLLMNWLAGVRPGPRPAPAGSAMGPAEVSFSTRYPGPNLQINPSADLATHRAREEEELTTYGWVDRDAGVVRIPIARAMERLIQRGLPARSANAPPPTGPSSLELMHQRSREP